MDFRNDVDACLRAYYGANNLSFENGLNAFRKEELFEIEIDDQTYCTNNEVNGFIYILDKDGDVGEKIGYFKDSDPIFYNEEN